jgi:hypothetical protein
MQGNGLKDNPNQYRRSRICVSNGDLFNAKKIQELCDTLCEDAAAVPPHHDAPWPGWDKRLLQKLRMPRRNLMVPSSAAGWIAFVIGNHAP